MYTSVDCRKLNLIRHSNFVMAMLKLQKIVKTVYIN